MTSLNLYGLNPFTFNKPPMENATDPQEKNNATMRVLSFKTPAVNTTQIDELINGGTFVDGKYTKVKDAIGIAGVYPRWMMQA